MLALCIETYSGKPVRLKGKRIRNGTNTLEQTNGALNERPRQRQAHPR